MISQKPKILIVDDEPVVCDVLHSELSERGYQCTAVLTGNDALAKLATQDFEVVLLDIKLPGISGLEVLTRIQSNHRNTVTVMITAVNDVETAVTAMRLGASDYIIKPFDLDRVTTSIRTVLETKKSRIEYEERLGEKAEVGPVNSSVEVQLVIPPPVEANQLIRLASQVQEILECRLLQVVGSWQEGTVMTMALPQAAPLLDILNKVGEMPEIGAIGEKPPKGKISPGLLRKVEAMSRLGNRPRKTIFVILKKGETVESKWSLRNTLKPDEQPWN